MPELDISSLDAPETEILNAPDPAPAEPTPEPEKAEAKAEPKVETAERLRDPDTGKFVAPVAAETPAEPATPPAAQPEKVIPLAAHIKERERWQSQLDANKRELDAVQARIAALEPKAPEPDFVEDPKGYVDAQAQKNAKELESLKAKAQELDNQRQFQEFQQAVSSREAEFVKATPDYYDALGYVRQLRVAQLTEMYPTATPEQIQQATAQEELQAAYQFLQQGRNPAEGAYKIAQTYGYKKAQETKTETKPKPLPKVDIPRAPVADPGQTLGSSGGGDVDPDEAEGGDSAEDIATEALRERFGKRA